MDIDKRTFEKALELYKDGNFWSCLDDFIKLSAKGDALSSFYAASMFLKGGNGVIRDLAKARSLFSLAIEQKFLPGAALNLAFMEYKGWGGPKSYADAMRHYMAVENDPSAKFMMGELLQNGLGCEKDQASALRWYDEAWSLGHPYGLRQAASIRWKQGKLFRGIFDYIKATSLLIWRYGFRRAATINNEFSFDSEASPIAFSSDPEQATFDRRAGCTREKFAVFIRFTLLVMSVPAMGGPTALAFGMMFISVIFCDSGPLERCAKMGVEMMAEYLFCASLPIPAVITLVRYKKPLNWYMYIYPWIMLALAVAVYKNDAVALGLRRVSYEYGCLALVAFAYLICHRTNARRELSPRLKRLD